jgi:hypothetical protein
MRSNRLPGRSVFPQGPILTHTVARATGNCSPARASRCAEKRPSKRRRTLFCPIARVGDRFGLFYALHAEAGELPNYARQLASEGSPTNGLHRQDQRR